MPLTRRVEYWQRELLQGRKRFKQWHQLFQEMTLFQQIENLCEEQIEAMQEIRDEIVQNYHHLMGEDLVDPQDILLIRLDDLTGHIERVQKHTTRLRTPYKVPLIYISLLFPTRPMKICGFWRLLQLFLRP